MKRKVAGILGGMGPEATIDLMKRVFRATPAQDDRDHVHLLVDNNPQVPSRIQALLEKTGESPGPCLCDMARKLESWGADFLAMPCNTARAIMMKKNRSKAFRHLWNDSKYNRGPLVSLIVLRIIVCMGLVAIPTSALLSTKWGIVLVASLSVIAIMIFSKRVKKHSILMERHFVSNLSAREAESERRAPIRRDFANHLLERDLHLTDIEVRPHSPSIGKTLKELNFRQKCNVNIVTMTTDRKSVV